MTNDFLSDEYDPNLPGLTWADVEESDRLTKLLVELEVMERDPLFFTPYEEDHLEHDEASYDHEEAY